MNPDNASQGGGAPEPQKPVDQQTATANVLRSQIDALYGNQPVAEPQPQHTQSIHAQRAAQSTRLASTRPLARQYMQQPSPTSSEPTADQRPQTAPAAPAASTITTNPAASTITTNPAAQPAVNQQAPSQATQPIQQQSIETTSPYDRTHTPNPKPQAEQWKNYHSAWQNYYQKYYEAYYTQQQAAAPAASQQQTPSNQPQQAVGSSNIAASGLLTQQTDLAATTEELSKDQALRELRQKLLGKVQHRAKKIRRSRHFVPIAAALAVVLVFLFLQYNRVLLSVVNAYVSPGAIDPQNIVIQPNAEGQITDDPRLIIPKINVDVPVIYGIGPDHDSQMAAMDKGVAHFAIPGANSRPGEVGNTTLAGHSSNDLFGGGDYKFIFAQLEKLNIGDMVYANYEGVRYSYVITKKEVVKPTEVNKLIYPTDKPVMTLITCTPLGTALNRLLVTAEQISPDPGAAATAPTGSGEVSESEAPMPGVSPTLIERLFGAR